MPICAMNFNQDTYLVHQDDSNESSLDSDVFSFENQLGTRRKCIKAELNECKSYAEIALSTAASVNDDPLIIQTRKNRDINCDILKANESMLSKYDGLVNDKAIKEAVNNLMLKNSSLEKSIKEREEDETALRKEYHLQNMALPKALEMYSMYFDLNVDVKNVSDSIYEASVRFSKENDDPSVIFRVDRTNRTVIDFKNNGLLTATEEENIRKRYGDLQNLPGLLCTLRDLVLSKQS